LQPPYDTENEDLSPAGIWGEALMGQDLSLRLAACINALPLRQGMRVLEIGCGCSPRLAASLERPLDKNRGQKLTVR